MKDKWLMRGVQLLEIVLNYLTVLAALLTVFALLPIEEPGILRMQLLLLVPLLDWGIRIWAGNFFVFTVLTVLLGGAVVFLAAEGPVQMGIFGAAAMLYTIRSFFVRIGRQEEKEGLLGPAFSLAVIGGSFFLCAYAGREQACYHIVNGALLFVFLYFLYRYLSRFAGYIHTNQSAAAHVPVKEMFGKGISMILVYGLFAVLIMGIFAGNGLTQGLTEGLKRAVFWFLQKVIWLLSLLFTDSVEEEAAQGGASVQIAEALGEAKEAPAWLQYLETILVNAVLAAVAAFLCYMAYRAVVAAIQSFREKKKGEAEQYREEEIRREKLKRGGKSDRKEKPLPFLARTPEERIRKSYIKVVRKLLSESVNGSETNGSETYGSETYGSETVREREERAAIEGRQDLARLGRLYEKARYGPDETGAERSGQGRCTRQEAKEAAECAARILKANGK